MRVEAIGRQAMRPWWSTPCDVFELSGHTPAWWALTYVLAWASDSVGDGMEHLQ